MTVIFVPMTCPQCHRKSAVPFAKSVLERKLSSCEPIDVHCGYDEATWFASEHDRSLMLKFMREDEAVRQMAWMPWPDVSDVVSSLQVS